MPIVLSATIILLMRTIQVSGWYTLVIFTASMQEYADPVIDWLDAGRGILAHRFFRDVSSSPFHRVQDTMLSLPSLVHSCRMGLTRKICPSLMQTFRESVS